MYDLCHCSFSEGFNDLNEKLTAFEYLLNKFKLKNLIITLF